MLPLLFISHMLGYDIWFYVSHILLHTPTFYWMHKIHHEKQRPVWTDTYHAHWAEGTLQSIGFLAPLLIGWSLADLLSLQTFLAFVFLQLRGLARHDPRATPWIGNHHLLHHELFTVNYGEYYLDWLFGTTDTTPSKRIDGLVRF